MPRRGRARSIRWRRGPGHGTEPCLEPLSVDAVDDDGELEFTAVVEDDGLGPVDASAPHGVEADLRPVQDALDAADLTDLGAELLGARRRQGARDRREDRLLDRSERAPGQAQSSPHEVERVRCRA